MYTDTANDNHIDVDIELLLRSTSTVEGVKDGLVPRTQCPKTQFYDRATRWCVMFLDIIVRR